MVRSDLACKMLHRGESRRNTPPRLTRRAGGCRCCQHRRTLTPKSRRWRRRQPDRSLGSVWQRLGRRGERLRPRDARIGKMRCGGMAQRAGRGIFRKRFKDWPRRNGVKLGHRHDLSRRSAAAAGAKGMPTTQPCATVRPVAAIRERSRLRKRSSGPCRATRSRLAASRERLTAETAAGCRHASDQQRDLRESSQRTISLLSSIYRPLCASIFSQPENSP